MKKIINLLFLVILFLSACNSEGNKAQSDETKSAVEINPEYLVSFDMDVSGMTCTGCESTIETGVSEIAGVQSVEALHLEAKTYVVFDSTLTSIKDVASAIESKGYKVEAFKLKTDEVVKQPAE